MHSSRDGHLLRHSEPGHDCACLGCRVDDLITRLRDALTGVPMNWGDTAVTDTSGVGRARGSSPSEGDWCPATIRVLLHCGFGVVRDGITCKLPEAEQRLVALVALRRRVGLT